MVSAELQPHRAGVWAKQSSGHPHSTWRTSPLLLQVLCSHLVSQGPEGCAGSPCCHSQGECDLRCCPGALAELGGCVPVGPAWIVPWAFPWGHCVHAYHRDPVLVSCGGPCVCIPQGPWAMQVRLCCARSSSVSPCLFQTERKFRLDTRK